MSEWFDVTWMQSVGVITSIALIYGAVLVLTRLFGLRSFSKLSASDFAMTIAVGSILGASIVNPTPSVLVAWLALSGLFGAQWAIARWRRSSLPFADQIDNDPVFLVCHGKVLEDNLRRTEVSHADIRAKLRAANVSSLSSVTAVVFETTGDVSVLHGGDQTDADDYALADVKGLPHGGCVGRRQP